MTKKQKSSSEKNHENHLGADGGWWRRQRSRAALLLVGAHVALHVAPLGEAPPAVGTLERLGAVVAQPVPLQAVEREEALGALGARVGPLARVRARVYVQVTLAGEALAAADAGVGRLARVAAAVQQQLARRQEGLAARGAQVVPLAAVHLHVAGDAALAEAPPADGAQGGGPLVQPLVLPERVAAQEGLLARGAGEAAAPLVQPLVLVVAREAAEALLALAAAVGRAVQPRVGLQLIGVLEHLAALAALVLVLGQVSGDGPAAQEALVFSGRLLPSPLRSVLRVEPLPDAFLCFRCAGWKTVVGLFLRFDSSSQLFASAAFYSCSLRCVLKRAGEMLLLDALLHSPVHSVSVTALRAGEEARRSP